MSRGAGASHRLGAAHPSEPEFFPDLPLTIASQCQH
ncbi:hypothetical protein CBM2585_A100024 [Cupriavidus taiwanensis]|nr:hypothetical protein CBM2585_A100024 [Cupriavidus taiwanensis]